MGLPCMHMAISLHGCQASLHGCQSECLCQPDLPLCVNGRFGFDNLISGCTYVGHVGSMLRVSE